MDVEEEMYEEHLDDEDSDAETPTEEATSNAFTTTTTTEVQFTAAAPTSPTSSSSHAALNNNASTMCKARTAERARKIRKLVVMFANHLEDFQRTILLSRRRWQNRQRRRQAMLRTFYVQHLIEMETNFLEMLPLPRTSVDTSSEQDVNDSQGFRFYEDLVMSFNEEQWLFTFHMSRKTFQWLCKQLKDVLPESPHLTLEKRIAMALYALATGDDYCSVGMLFNVSRYVVGSFVQRFAEALLEKLGYCLLAMPKHKQEYEEIRQGFQQASGMPPLVVGVLGVCELPLGESQTDGENAVNIVLQALIDDKLLIRKVRVQTNRLSILLEIPNNDLLKLDKLYINGIALPCFVVTPETYYPMRTWMLQRYKAPKEPHEYDFNEAIDNIMLFKDRAFKRLFGRWKILQRKVNLDPRAMESIAVACCALHNLLEEAEDSYSLEWEADVDLSCCNVNNITRLTNALPNSQESLELRDFLARIISSTEFSSKV